MTVGTKGYCWRLRVALIFGCLVCVLSSGCVSGMFYHPDQVYYHVPKKKEPIHEDVYFMTEDGMKLNGWFLAGGATPEAAKGTVLFFHGNAQNLSSHVYAVDWLSKAGYNVFIFDYRGYGKSEGSPSRAGLYKDSVAAVRYVMLREDVAADKVVLFGQSLGGAQAIAVTDSSACKGVRGVISESSFYSYTSVVSDTLKKSWLLRWVRGPLSYLLITNSYSPSKQVGKVGPRPIFFIHGLSDRVVDPHHMQRLHNAASRPRGRWLAKEAGHLEVHQKYGRMYERHIVSFLENVLGDDTSGDTP